MQHTLASDMGTSVPPYGIGLPENTSDKAAKQYVNEREGKVGGNSSRKGTGRKQKTTGRLMTNRSTSRSTARRTGRSSYRGSTGRSSIATIDISSSFIHIINNHVVLLMLSCCGCCKIL